VEEPDSVRLYGILNSSEEKEKIEKLVKKIKGIKNIKNELVVLTRPMNGA
jgi:osmotically-inducible protein OsmY